MSADRIPTIRFSVIGSGTAVPSPGRGAPCCHVSVPGGAVVFDAGSGSVGALMRRGIDIRDVPVLALSHFHPDHTADLVPWLFALGNPEFGHRGGLRLLGPSGLRLHLDGLRSVYGRWIEPPGLTLDVVELTEGGSDLGFAALTAARTGHTGDSLSFRLTAGEVTIVYGGDTPGGDALVHLARGADLLVLESSFPDDQGVEGHLTPSEAGLIAARSGARRLLLTHFYPAADAADVVVPARRVFDGPVAAAHDGLTVDV